MRGKGHWAALYKERKKMQGRRNLFFLHDIAVNKKMCL